MNPAQRVCLLSFTVALGLAAFGCSSDSGVVGGGSSGNGSNAGGQGGAANNSNAGNANGGNSVVSPGGGQAGMMAVTNPLDGYVRYDDLDLPDGGLDQASLFELDVATNTRVDLVFCGCLSVTQAELDSCAARALEPPASLVQACEEEVFFEDPRGKEFMECEIRAGEELLFCSLDPEATLSCVDCLTAYIDAAQQCPEILEDSTWLALEDQCYLLEPFQCDDPLMSVPRTRLCDGTEECADGADEAAALCQQ